MCSECGALWEVRENPRKPKGVIWHGQVFTTAAPEVNYGNQAMRVDVAPEVPPEQVARAVVEEFGLFPEEVHHVDVWVAGGDTITVPGEVLRVRPNPREESAWQEAKKASMDQYGEIRWPVVMHIYKRKVAAR